MTDVSSIAFVVAANEIDLSLGVSTQIPLTLASQGLQGPIGPDGTPGSVWRNGVGVPSDSLGVDGDYYLDTSTGDVYLRSAGAYGVVANIKGATGPTGPNTVSTSTATNITGLIKGDGANILQAVAGTDYLTPSAIIDAAHGGLGADNSAATGIPVYASGVATVTAATGTLAPVRASAPTIANPIFTGQVLAAKGTAAAPGISFSGSGVDGVFSNAFGSVSLTANMVEALRVTGGQCLYNVGSVGTPGFAFIGSGTDGIYHPASGIVGIVGAGVESFRVTSTGVAVSGGATLKKMLSATASLDFSSIAAGSTGELTITVTGAAVGDTVIVNPSTSLESGLVAMGYVSAANTVTVRLANVTGSAIDPAAKTWRATVLSF